jgi:hypothetical protein
LTASRLNKPNPQVVQMKFGVVSPALAFYSVFAELSLEIPRLRLASNDRADMHQPPTDLLAQR